MTDEQKLQQLFDAALKDSPRIDKAPAPLSPKATIPAAHAAPAPLTETQREAAAPPSANLGLDEKASSELANLLESQNQRKTSKLRRNSLISLATCLVIVGGGLGWFVQSPQRVQAFRQAVKEARSVGDIGAILASYQKSVDRVAARSNHINEATEAMGVSSNQDDAEDPNFEAEMLAISGGEGKSTAQRDQLLKEKFGKIAEAARTKAGRTTAENSANSSQPSR
ncbi:MAG: hypothetical protein H7Y36_09400 [Armatimonadetes bacterium]|nr:hypothetical protein [Akkermansiaceae bacterium]